MKKDTTLQTMLSKKKKFKKMVSILLETIFFIADTTYTNPDLIALTYFANSGVFV